MQACVDQAVFMRGEGGLLALRPTQPQIFTQFSASGIRFDQAAPRRTAPNHPSRKKTPSINTAWCLSSGKGGGGGLVDPPSRFWGQPAKQDYSRAFSNCRCSVPLESLRPITTCQMCTLRAHLIVYGH